MRDEAGPRRQNGAEPAMDSALRTVARRFLRHRLAVAGVVVLAVIALMAIFAPLVTPYRPDAVDMFTILHGSSARHILGTDQVGRDVYTRMIYAGRVSLAIAFSVALISTFAGTLVGALAGYFGGWVDTLLMRFVDLMLAIPALFLLLLVVDIFRPNVATLVFVISVLFWMPLARIIRGEFLSLRSRDFVEAARAGGASHRRIIVRHILPNAMAPIIVNLTLQVGAAIYTESALSFLGFGVQPPTASWGSMLNDAQAYLWTQPLLPLYPGLMILLSIVSVNLIGDGLRDALDPRQRR